MRPSFSVSQNSDRAQVLFQMKEYFGCGSIRPDYSDKTLKYEVRSLNDLMEKIIPFFDQFSLQSEKQRDFLLFKQVCNLMVNDEHVSKDGLEKIEQLANQMNSGKRKYRSILKDIVSATSNSGENTKFRPARMA